MNKHKIFATAAAALLSLAATAQTKLDNTTATPKIITPGDTITLGYNCDFAVVPINATCEYTPSTPETWVKVQKDGNGNLAMFSEFNVGGVNRSATVTLASADGSYVKSLVVNQLPNTMDGAASRSIDRKISVVSATANQSMDGYGIEKSYDNNTGTFYHSPWGGTSTTFPVVLTYRLATPNHLNYAVYTPRQDGNWNGNWGNVDVEYQLADSSWVKLRSSDFGQVSTDTQIKFGEDGTDNVCAVRYTIRDGYAGFASCAEMAFYERDTTTTQYLRQYFVDDLCTQLQPGVTRENAVKIKDQFVKRLVYSLLDGNYSTKFRVGEFSAYKPYSTLQQELKVSNTYCNHENPTGISVEKGERIAVIVEGITDYSVGMKVRCFGPTNFEESNYTLTNGVNIITVNNKGNIYVNYYTNDYAKAPKVKMHFAMCTENGYFDLTKGMTNDDWNEIIANAKSDCMDLLGYHCQVNFPTQTLKQNCKDAVWLVNTYDSIVSSEFTMMGLYEYQRYYGNHMTVICVASSAGLYHASNDGMCVPVNALSQPSSSDPSYFDYWGAGHELGHNNQTDGVLWIGLTEVTNNLLAAFAQDRTEESGFHRMENESNGDKSYGFVNRIVKPNLLNPNSTFHQSDNVWSSMIAFWGIHCYTYGAGVDSLAYPKVFEKMRTMDLPQKNNGIGQNADYTADGEQQLNFVKQVCDMTQIDFTDYFRLCGMMMPHNSIIGDYSNRRLLITQDMVDELQSYIDGKNYVKAPTGLYLINIYNTDAFRNKATVPEGIAVGTGCTVSGGKITIRHASWPNAVGFKAYNANHELVEIYSYGYGYQGSSKNYRPSYTSATLANDVAYVYAVSYDGTETLCYQR